MKNIYSYVLKFHLFGTFLATATMSHYGAEELQTFVRLLIGLSDILLFYVLLSLKSRSIIHLMTSL
jgi:hypothetical protein